MTLMKNISLLIYTLLKGNFVGKDENGNKFYQSNVSHGTKKDKRWVLFKKEEDTNIQPNWHAWLHHLVNKVPNDKLKKNFFWQKKKTSNFTGTDKAYLPKGHILNKKKGESNKNYVSWKPNKK